MFNLKKNYFFLILFLSFLLLSISPLFIQAQLIPTKKVEVDYPEIDEWRPETIERGMLPSYIKYIFNFAIVIGGLVVFGMLIYGGFRYITSAGNPTALSDAKDQILSAFVGIIILLSSWLILTAINPELTILRLPEVFKVTVTRIPGVFLSTKDSFPSDEEIERGDEKVYHFVSSANNLRAIGGNVRSLRIINEHIFKIEEKEPVVKKSDFYYGVILHAQENFQGNCSYVRSLAYKGRKEVRVKESSITPLSITVFEEDEIFEEDERSRTEVDVMVYSEPDFGGDSKRLEVTVAEGGESLNFEELEELTGRVWSIKMTGGNFLLILYGKNARGAKMCAVFDSSQATLEGLQINKCKVSHSEEERWGFYDKSCAISYALIPIHGSYNEEVTLLEQKVEQTDKEIEEIGEEIRKLEREQEAASKAGDWERVGEIDAELQGFREDEEEKEDKKKDLEDQIDEEPEKPEKEVKIVLNEPDNLDYSKSCNEICQEAGSTCESVGYDNDAQNMKMWNGNFIGQCSVKSNITCNTKMKSALGAHCPKGKYVTESHHAQWTKCRCVRQID